jgi:phenylalanine-4-hydroxylase
MTTSQRYSDYTAEDFDVWSILFDRQMAFLKGRVCPEFYEGIAKLGYKADSIPEFLVLSDRLERITGWRLAAVDDALSSEEFFTLLVNRRFPSATTLRPMAELAHTKVPDMFHDLFGHIPLLTNPVYSDFIVRMSEAALPRAGNPAVIKRLGWAYKWTIEYGLTGFGEEQKVYGAGLISSSKELDYVFTDQPRKLPFSPQGVLATSHIPASLQDHYFVIRSFDELVEGLPQMAHLLDTMELA